MRQEEKVMNLEELKVVDADVAAATIEAEMARPSEQPYRADRIRELGQ